MAELGSCSRVSLLTGVQCLAGGLALCLELERASGHSYQQDPRKGSWVKAFPPLSLPKHTCLIGRDLGGVLNTELDNQIGCGYICLILFLRITWWGTSLNE